MVPFGILGFSLIISYERAKAESLGLEAKGGLMERAERIILLELGLLVHVDPAADPVGDARPDRRHRRAAVHQGVEAGGCHPPHGGQDRDPAHPAQTRDGPRTCRSPPTRVPRRRPKP